MEIKLKSFVVPTLVYMETPPRPRGEGFREGVSFKLSDVPEEDLAKLCDDFRRNVFLEAAKDDPQERDD